MRTDATEPSGGSGKRRAQVLARWVSVERAARMLDVSVSLVRRLEAAGVFGAGNSGVVKAPGRAVGELRIRVCALNGYMERMAGEREMDRQFMAERFRQGHEVAHV